MKRFFSILLLISFLLAGCFPVAAPVAQPEVPAVAALPTETSTANVVFITATPKNEPPSEQSASPSPEPSLPAGNESIVMDPINDLGGGVGEVSWKITGGAPYGFRLVWSDTNVAPVYPQDAYAENFDPAAHAARFSGQLGKVYYVRVCRVTVKGCDLYSNLGIFTFTKKVQPTNTPRPVASNNGGGGGSPSTSLHISITSMSSAGANKAKITWTATGGDFSNGFRIVYSKTHLTPVYGVDDSYTISDGNARIAYVTGTPGYWVFYRVCRWTGSTCDTYSGIFAYGYSGYSGTATALSTMVYLYDYIPVSLGVVRLVWYSYGSFPNGYKIVYSKTNQSPTPSDAYIDIPKQETLQYDFHGEAGQTYYVRICKAESGGCVNYSPTLTVTFPSAATSISLDSVYDMSSGQALASYSANGDFANGTALVYSTSNNPPIINVDTTITTTNSEAEDVLLTATPGQTVYVMACSLTSASPADCDVRSDVISFTFAKVEVSVGDASSTQVTLNWTLAGETPASINLYSSLTSTNPREGNSTRTRLSLDPASVFSYTYTLPTPGLTYYLRLASVLDSGVFIYSNVITYPSVSDVVLSVAASEDPLFPSLTWTAGSAAGTTGYKIYRVSGSGDPYYAGTVVATISDPAITTYVETETLTSGTTYQYRVCSSNSTTACTAVSNAASYTLP